MIRRLFNPLFVITTVIPTALTALYALALAPDIYTSESHFITRGQSRGGQGGIGALRRGQPLAATQDDAFAVHEYILSRDALKALVGKEDVYSVLPGRFLGFNHRFPSLSADNRFDSLFERYRDAISIDYDAASSATRLRVRALTAADAARINDMILQLSESLFRNLYAGARRDAVRHAEAALRESAPRVEGNPAAVDLILREKRNEVILSALETAYREEMQPQFRIDRLVRPNVPDSASEAVRISPIVIAAILGLIGWGILALLISGIVEHLD